MSLREYLSRLEQRGDLLQVNTPISRRYEIAALLKELEPRPLLLNKVKESPYRVVGNLFCGKSAFADYFGIQRAEIIPFLTRAIDLRSPCAVVEQAPCQEVVIDQPDLDDLPILRHCKKDGGSYISSGVVVARHPQYGQNADFHR